MPAASLVRSDFVLSTTWSTRCGPHCLTGEFAEAQRGQGASSRPLEWGSRRQTLDPDARTRLLGGQLYRAFHSMLMAQMGCRSALPKPRWCFFSSPCRPRLRGGPPSPDRGGPCERGQVRGKWVAAAQGKGTKRRPERPPHHDLTTTGGFGVCFSPLDNFPGDGPLLGLLPAGCHFTVTFTGDSRLQARRPEIASQINCPGSQ